MSEVSRLALSARPLCPKLTRVISAIVMVPIAPAVQAWIPAETYDALSRKTAQPERTNPAGTKA